MISPASTTPPPMKQSCSRVPGFRHCISQARIPAVEPAQLSLSPPSDEHPHPHFENGKAARTFFIFRGLREQFEWL